MGDEKLEEFGQDSGIMTTQERLQWLTGIIRGGNATTADKLKASDQMNKMLGAYVTRVEGDLQVAKLEELL